MLRLSSLLLLLIASCNSEPKRNSDKSLSENMGFKEVVVNPKATNRLIFNVDRIKPFNYCQISTNSGLYILDHNKSDSLLVISDSLVTQMDSVSSFFGPFVSGYRFNMILGDKLNSDPSDISMSGHIAYKIIIRGSFGHIHSQ